MTKLEQLIEELCQDGVEYMPLQSAVSIERGKRVVKQQLSQEEGYPVYQNSLTPLGFHSKYNYSAETTFIIVAGAAGEIGYSNVDFWAADDCFAIVCPKNILNRYIYHVLMNHQRNIKGHVRKASIPRLPRAAIDSLIIPVPPLEVQEEIVRILDTFTTLEAELEAELSARKKQYEYYREQLLTFRLPASSQNAVEGALSALQTDRQTDRQTDSAELLAVDIVSQRSRIQNIGRMSSL